MIMPALVLSAVFASGAALTAAKKLEPCTVAQARLLEKSIREQRAGGMVNIYRMLNPAGTLVGFYATNRSGSDMYAEVCEPLSADDSLTTADHWHYWDTDGISTHPAAWAVGRSYGLSQDEGIAVLTVLDITANNVVTARLSVEGLDDDGETVTVRTETVTLSP